jgi:hypothetical protein
MADITDPIVIDFSNEYLRPLSEKLRDAQIVLEDAKIEYLTNVSDLLTGFVDSDVLADNRPNAPTVTKADMTGLIGHFQDTLAELDQAGMDALRAKFSVRPPGLL